MYIPSDIESTIFLKWFTFNDPRPLIVHGARQVGKTATIKHFAETHFKNIYYFNLVYNRTINFNNEFIDSKDSVIILDEVQAAPQLYSSLKPLHSKIILISSHLTAPSNDTYNVCMTGFTFKEFLIASNHSALIDTIKTHLSSLKPFPNEIHEQMLNIFSIYLSLGGYPEVISIEHFWKGFAMVCLK